MDKMGGKSRHRKFEKFIELGVILFVDYNVRSYVYTHDVLS